MGARTRVIGRKRGRRLFPVSALLFCVRFVGRRLQRRRTVVGSTVHTVRAQDKHMYKPHFTTKSVICRNREWDFLYTTNYLESRLYIVEKAGERFQHWGRYLKQYTACLESACHPSANDERYVYVTIIFYGNLNHSVAALIQLAHSLCCCRYFFYRQDVYRLNTYKKIFLQHIYHHCSQEKGKLLSTGTHLTLSDHETLFQLCEFGLRKGAVSLSPWKGADKTVDNPYCNDLHLHQNYLVCAAFAC